jgi:hypothetical protein
MAAPWKTRTNLRQQSVALDRSSSLVVERGDASVAST